MAENQTSRMTPEDQIVGKIALKNGLISEQQLREGIGLLENGENGSLGAILCSKGYLSEGQLAAISRKVDTMRKGHDKKSAREAPPPRKGASPVQEIANRDFSHMAGKPLDEFLALARELGASDFHFQTGAPPFLRVHGHIVSLKHPVLSEDDTARGIKGVLSEAQWSKLVEQNDYDYCYESETHGRYRANVFRQRKGYDAVFRIIPDHVPSLEELHLPETLQKFTQYSQGIVLVTGPGGCGKSSTMAALIELINQNRYDHVVTVEDPIEFIFNSKNCNVNQRHVREHTESFATALRSALRADPDVIMVGEMRDLETISMAITAAETGHLVMATLHTTNAIRSIDRIIDVFPPKEQEQIRAMVSESIRGVISQQLIPRADGMGREPALEIMFSTPAVGNLIRERKTFQLLSVLQTGRKMGMCTMDESIQKLLSQGVITREQAIFNAENPATFRN